MKKMILMILALGISLPVMASEKVIDMYKSGFEGQWNENVR